MKTEDEIVQEGAEAFRQGKTLADNPYRLSEEDFDGTFPMYSSWSCAWIAAQKAKYQQDTE